MRNRCQSYSEKPTQVTKSRMVASELSLYCPVAHFFKQRGYQVRTNTKHGDIVGYNPYKDTLISVEVKMNDSRSAFGQALTYSDFADLVYVGLPESGKLRLELLERLGLGLLILQPEGKRWHVFERLSPRVNQPADQVARALLVTRIIGPATPVSPRFLNGTKAYDAFSGGWFAGHLHQREDWKDLIRSLDLTEKQKQAAIAVLGVLCTVGQRDASASLSHDERSAKWWPSRFISAHKLKESFTAISRKEHLSCRYLWYAVAWLIRNGWLEEGRMIAKGKVAVRGYRLSGQVLRYIKRAESAIVKLWETCE